MLLFLNDAGPSLQGALQVLNSFATVTGLKVNWPKSLLSLNDQDNSPPRYSFAVGRYFQVFRSAGFSSGLGLPSSKFTPGSARGAGQTEGMGELTIVPFGNTLT